MLKKRITSEFWAFIKELKGFTQFNTNLVKIGCFVTLLAIMSFFIVYPSQALSDGYPQIANYFLKTPISTWEVEKLATWDVVILGMQVQDTNPEIFRELRNLNPKIKIIAYLSAMEFPNDNFRNLESINGPWHKMYSQISPEWYLKNGKGQIHSIWPGNYSFNVTKYCPEFNGQKFNEWLPKFVKSELIPNAQGGNWDGVFYDNVLTNIQYTNNGQIDLDNNGKVDDGNWADQVWREGMLTLLKNTRDILGKDKIILVNSSSYGQAYINGRLYETWPDEWSGGWIGNMKDYENLENNISNFPQIIILNPNTENTGNNLNYQKIRFGLTSTLQGNGYFAFDFGTQDHSQLWWYDEYDVNLGYPNSQSKEISSGVLRRDFTKGVALVNATNKSQTVDLGPGVYEKIRGTQDPVVNSGELVKKITLNAQDGIILLKKLELIQEEDGQETILKGVPFTNGAYVRVFDKRGNVQRTGFYAYDSRFAGGSEIVIDDLDNDGQDEIVVAGKSKIEIYKNNELINSFYPYGEKYNKGINLALGNVQGDERKEIITGTQNGSQPLIKVFGNEGTVLNDGWYAYAPDFYGGVQIALGDLNGNGYQEIVTGAGFGGGPHVRIFDATGHLFDPGFFPYDPLFRGGVNVTCADLNTDGKDEIITGAGRTGGPHIQVYDKIGHLVDPGFFAFDPNKRDGVRVGAVDIDGDGSVEVLGMSL